MNVAVILAGGVGNRFGADIPKQFVKVLGKPVISYTIDVFEKHPDVDAILVVCVKSYMNYIWELKNEYGFSKLKWVTEGGSTFQESVLNGVNYLKEKVQKEDVVLFHFSASPFVKPEIISDVIKVCRETGSNAISTTDYFLLSGKKKLLTSVSDKNNYTEEYIDRDSIAVMNTPHAFLYGFIADLYKEAVQSGVINTVEPHTTTLMYALGKRIYFSKGDQSNIKITKKEDLELFEGYALMRQRSEQAKMSGDVVIFLADGFEEGECIVTVDILRRAGLNAVTASVTGRRDVSSSRNIPITADSLAENIDYADVKAIVLPGGRIGVDNLRQSRFLADICMDFSERNKTISAICAAPSILASLGILNGIKATVHPDFERYMEKSILVNQDVVVDRNIITGRGLGATIPFALTIVEKMISREKADGIAKAICFHCDR